MSKISCARDNFFYMSLRLSLITTCWCSLSVTESSFIPEPDTLRCRERTFAEACGIATKTTQHAVRRRITCPM